MFEKDIQVEASGAAPAPQEPHPQQNPYKLHPCAQLEASLTAEWGNSEPWGRYASNIQNIWVHSQPGHLEWSLTLQACLLLCKWR